MIAPLVLAAKITSYCTPGVTASGARTRDGIVAANPPWRLGSRVTIAGRRYVIADRIGDGDPYHFDVFRGSCLRALAFGVRHFPVRSHR